MNICAVTGSYDPITIGHLDIVKRAREIFDKVVLLILDNPLKKYILDVDARLTLCREAVAGIDGVEVAYYDGYAVEYCISHGIAHIVRGIRDRADYEYEAWLDSENRKIGDVETVYLRADDRYVLVSSTRARELLSEGDYTMIPVAEDKVRYILGR